MSWTYISDTFGIVTPKINDNNFERVVVEGEIYDRFSDSPKFTFVGYDYNRIKMYLDSGGIIDVLNCYQNGALQISFTINYENNIDEVDGIIEATIDEVLDQYTDLLKNIDVDYNVLGVGEFNILYTSTYIDPLELSVTPFSTPSGNPVGSEWADLSGGSWPITPIYARQKKTIINSAVEYYELNEWTVLTVGAESTVMVKDWAGDYDAPVLGTDDFKQTFGTSSLGLSFGEQYPPVNDGLSLYTFIQEQTILPAYRRLLLDNTVYYGTSIATYKNAIPYISVIKYIVNQCDSSITFDNTDTATDSFYYFKDFVPYAEMVIIGISEFVLTDSGTVNSNVSTVLNIRLGELLAFLKDRFSLFYEIDDSKVFRLIHLSDHRGKASASLPAHNTTTFLNRNWSKRTEQLAYNNDKKYNRIKRSTTAGGADFLGVDIVFPQVFKTNELEIGNSTVFTDIKDIFQRKGRYPSESISNYVLISAESAVNNNAVFSFQNDISAIDGNDSNRYRYIDNEITGYGEQYIGTDAYNLHEPEDGRPAVFYSNVFAALKGTNIIVSFSTSNYVIGSFALNVGYLRGEFQTASADMQTIYVSPSLSGVQLFSFVVPIPETRSDYRIGFYATTLDITIEDIRVRIGASVKAIEGTGALTGEPNLPNVEISIANTDARDFAQASSSNAIINNQSVILAPEKVNRFVLQKIKLPITNLADQFSFGEYVITDRTNFGELQKVVTPDKGSLTEIEILT